MKAIVFLYCLCICIGCHYNGAEHSCEISFDVNSHRVSYRKSDDCLYRVVNSVCVGPYAFTDKRFDEIIEKLMRDCRQKISSTGCEYGLGFSGGVSVKQERLAKSFTVPRMPILQMFSFVAERFDAEAVYRIGCIWMKPKEG